MTLGGNGLEEISNGDNQGPEGDILAFESPGVACAVNVLMMRRCNRRDVVVDPVKVDPLKDVLEGINFDGIYHNIPSIAAAHHENIDGTGYPWGLKGEDIPLGALIISVADFFEAITSKRHYRDPMPTEIAYKLLRQHR